MLLSIVPFVVANLDILEIPLQNATVFLVSSINAKFEFVMFMCCCPVAPEPPKQKPSYVNPCAPSPCGPNSQCRDIGGTPSCSCLPNYIGSPPNCRPECTINSECSSNLACIREKCRDPCPGSCGVGAQCNVINHTPVCTCPDGYTGDPFNNCFPKPLQRKWMTLTT